MWIYVFRRLLVMIPTLFGVTVVAFCIMQLAPGDPLKAQLVRRGRSARPAMTREAYLIMRRDLKLDRPLLLNFRLLSRLHHAGRQARFFRGLSIAQIRQELAGLAAAPDAPENAARLAYLRSLNIADFDQLLADPDSTSGWPTMITTGVQLDLEDVGARRAASDGDAPRSSVARQQQIGAIRADPADGGRTVPDQFPSACRRGRHSLRAGDMATVVARAEPGFPQLAEAAASDLAEKFQTMLELESRARSWICSNGSTATTCGSSSSGCWARRRSRKRCWPPPR
jgi:hypothetical protein